MQKIPRTRDLFDLNRSMAEPLLRECEFPYEAIPRLREFILEKQRALDSSFEEIAPEVFVAKGVKLSRSATIEGPAIICHGAEIRHCAYIRGSVIIGEGAVIGNSSEIKNSIIFDESQLPHYNYVGDSIIGYRGHLGAGAIASNLRLDRRSVIITDGMERRDTKLRKLGVMLGDNAEVGCGCVLCPGSMIGRDAIVYPLLTVRGIIGENIVYKGDRG